MLYYVSESFVLVILIFQIFLLMTYNENYNVNFEQSLVLLPSLSFIEAAFMLIIQFQRISLAILDLTDCTSRIKDRYFSDICLVTDYLSNIR